MAYIQSATTTLSGIITVFFIIITLDWVFISSLYAYSHTGMPARRLQGCDARLSVAVWHFAFVPSRRLPSCRRCLWATTTFHSEWV